MKKLLFIALFSVGLFTVSNAQFSYVITNNSTAKWNVEMNHNGGTTPFFESGIQPGTTVTGSDPNTFAIPAKFKATSSNGCIAYKVINMLMSGNVPATCSSLLASDNVDYDLAQDGSGTYILTLSLN